MICNKTEMQACYKAVQELDELSAILIDASNIMAAIGRGDITDAIYALQQKREEFNEEIMKYRTRGDAESTRLHAFDSVDKFLESRHILRMTARPKRRRRVMRWPEEPKSVKRIFQDQDLDVSELEADLEKVGMGQAC